MYTNALEASKNSSLDVAEEKREAVLITLMFFLKFPHKILKILVIYSSTIILRSIHLIMSKLVERRKALKYSIFQPKILLLKNRILKTYHDSEVSFILKKATFVQRILVVGYPNLK